MAQNSDSFAALDLGSNSFHLLIASFQDDKLRIIDRHKDMVRLAAGLDDNGVLSEEAQQRALDSLAKVAPLEAAPRRRPLRRPPAPPLIATTPYPHLPPPAVMRRGHQMAGRAPFTMMPASGTKGTAPLPPPPPDPPPPKNVTVPHVKYVPQAPQELQECPCPQTLSGSELIPQTWNGECAKNSAIE